jgi:fimbrial chaperone protein
MRAVRLFTALALGGLIGIAEGEAATVHVAPTRLVLQAGAASTTVTIRNDGAAPIRFQVTAHRWVAGDGAAVTLEPTDDLVVYPTLLSIAPGERRVLRLASRTKGGDAERTYRLVLEELPDPTETESPSGLQMLTRLNIPVFASPAARRVQASLDAATGGSSLQVRLSNRGTVHVTAQRFAVTGRGRNGAAVWTRTLRPWYLLVSETRLEPIALTAEECAATDEVVAEVEFEELPGRPLRERISRDRWPCPR